MSNAKFGNWQRPCWVHELTSLSIHELRVFAEQKRRHGFLPLTSLSAIGTGGQPNGCRSVAHSVNGGNGRLNACGFFAIDFCYDKLNNYDGRALNRKTCIDNWRMRLLMLAKGN